MTTKAPKAILIKGQIVTFSNSERADLTMRAAADSRHTGQNMGRCLYEWAKYYALSSKLTR
jgi:hypothetical protein